MKETIFDALYGDSSIDIITIIINNVVAMVAAFFLMFTYKITYSGPTYSRKFNLTLGAITITTTMIMGTISNNVALSLGMVGALSIIRFRTAVKDIRDAAYIFWAISIGIGCGVAQYSLIGIGSAFLFVFMIITKQSGTTGQMMLIVQGELKSQNQIETTVNNFFNNKAYLTIKNVSVNSCELVYKISEDVFKKSNGNQMVDITQRLIKIDGVLRANLVEQQDDMSR